MLRWSAAVLLLNLPLTPLSTASVSADTVVIAALKDNTLYDDPTGALSNGAGESLFAGLTGEPRVVRALLEFDVAGSMPAESTITHVSLTLYMAQASIVTPFAPNTVGVHRALAEWGEGTSHAALGEGQGGASSADDATWIHAFFPNSFWSSPGGDYVAAASASLLVPIAAGFNSWSSPQLVADAQLFLDQPGDNHGWMLVATETANARRFESRSTPLPENRPALSIEFVPPAPSVPSLSPVGVMFLLLVAGPATALLGLRGRTRARG